MSNARIFLLLAILLGWSAYSSAQPGHRPHFPPLETWKTELQLTPDQETQLSNLRANTQTQLEALRQAEYPDPEARREAHRQLMHTQRNQAMDILTAEQRTTLRNLRDERRAAWEQVDKTALHRELKAYRQENVLPVLRAQRAKLEAQIDPADQAAIAQLRQLMADKRAAWRNDHHSQRPSRADMQQRRRQWQDQHATELAQLKGLVDKYDAQIETLLREIAPQHAQWQTDQQAIFGRYAPAGETARPHHLHQPTDVDGHHKTRHKARFLLLEPPTSATPGNAHPASTQLVLAPNPASNQATLSFVLPTAGPVRIDLLDESGAVLRTLTQQTYSAGSHRLDLDLSGLKPGVYYCNLTDAGGSQSLKLIRID